MKKLTDFKIFYKGDEITNILYMVEITEQDYRGDPIPSLEIRYIGKDEWGKDGKLLLKTFRIEDLTFEEKENLQQKLSEIQAEKEELERELVNKENACSNYKYRIDNTIEWVKQYQNDWAKNDEVNSDMTNLLEILEGAEDEM